MGMMVIKLGEEEGDREALERELPGCTILNILHTCLLLLEEGGDFDEELIIGFHPQMAQHTSYKLRSGLALQTTFRFFLNDHI